MARASHLLRPALALAGALAAAAPAAAGGQYGDGVPKAGNTFVRITVAPAAATRVSAPPAGAGIAPKAIVTNPYNVPLLQNAGSLRAVR